MRKRAFSLSGRTLSARSRASRAASQLSTCTLPASSCLLALDAERRYLEVGGGEVVGVDGAVDAQLVPVPGRERALRSLHHLVHVAQDPGTEQPCTEW